MFRSVDYCKTKVERKVGYFLASDVHWQVKEYFVERGCGIFSQEKFFKRSVQVNYHKKRGYDGEETANFRLVLAFPEVV